jgi:Flp pilus assembly protein TadG
VPHLHDESGSTLVEFALVAPAVILILVACLDFARALNAYVTIANASREGARYAIVHPDVGSAAIRARVAERVAPLDTGVPLGVSATYDDGTGARAWPDTGLPASSLVPAEMKIRVTTTYSWYASTWIIGSLFDVTSGSRTFGSTSTMVVIR